MSEGWTLFSQDPNFESDEDYRVVFGEHAVISKVGAFRLIHLDEPSPDEIRRRVERFDPQDFFEDDCPLCQMLREQGGAIVYDGG